MNYKDIKAIVLDFDGVLTDGTFLWCAHGGESKRMCYADRTGIAMAREQGIRVAIVSAESSRSGIELVQRYADKVGAVVPQRCWHDKAEAVRQLCAANDMTPDQVAFVGDDIGDVCAMNIVGLSACPADAQQCAKDAAKLVLKRNGGSGAVRELIDLILA